MVQHCAGADGLRELVGRFSVSAWDASTSPEGLDCVPDRVGSTVGGGHAFSVVPGVSGSPGTCDTAATGLRSSAGGGEGQLVCRQTFSDSVESSNVFVL